MYLREVLFFLDASRVSHPGLVLAGDDSPLQLWPEWCYKVVAFSLDIPSGVMARPVVWAVAMTTWLQP
jgi:hypothetical protein